MAEVQSWLPTDASNIDLWPENMPFSGVNNGGRAMQGVVARWYRDTDGSLTASGAPNVFTVTSNRAIPALFNNLIMSFTANFSITGSAFLSLNGLGNVPILRSNGNNLAQGDIVTGQPLVVVYKSTPNVWFLTTAPAATIVGQSFIDYGENTPANPAADVARLYARDDGTGRTIMAYRDSAGVESLVLGPPSRAYAEYLVNEDLTVDIPQDDSIPQSNEGTQILSAAITLRRANSRVRARFQGFGGFVVGAVLTSWTAALFIGSATNAAAASISGPRVGNSSADNFNACTLEFEHAPGSIGPFTYTIRVGTVGGAVRLNGFESGRLLGGAARATLVLEEVFV